MGKESEATMLRVHNAAQLVCVFRHGAGAGKGENPLHIIENGTVIVNHEGKIEAIGSENDPAFRQMWAETKFEQDIDATGKCCLPGFVDAHTHPVWSGDRVHEFAMKLAGATYMEIHAKGGGINFTVRHVKESTEDELLGLLLPRLDRMLRHGTTLVEAKTGYGLDLETELKMLRAINSAQKVHPIEISPTYLPAHAVPHNSNAATATKDIVTNQIPTLKRLIDEGKVQCDNIDVFCEKGVFELADSREILTAAAGANLAVNFHGEELSCLHSAEMGAEIGATAISHLEEVSPEGIQAMASKGVVAVLLPTTAHLLRLRAPPARAMIDAGVEIALGSDFNPNAHCLSMPFVMNLACIQLRMSMAEVLVAATINSAKSIKKDKMHGSLEEGKWGDMVVVNANAWEHVIYQMVDPPIGHVIRKGKVVYASS
eukprot:c6570_g1_i1.p1 GENE.c6570_g1_i1~~c6570_g1_i1.p1  ORF type:complete len:429 (+),score=102.05 c6570_g1_i1:1-1287(+)